MDTVQARIDVTNWLTGFVEKPNALLNGWAPCPYARAARLQNKIAMDIGKDPYLDLKQIAQQGIADLDVIIRIYDPAKWPLELFRSKWTQAQQECLAPNGLLCLEDHPSESESVNGVVMNQGTWALLLIQSRHKLEEAARQLAAKGYYDHWPEEYLRQVLDHREDPRR